MFLTSHIPMLISKATLRVDRDADGERVRVADLGLVIEPFSFELAGEMEDALRSHLYQDDKQIRPELEDVTLNPRVASQQVTVASAPDAPILATLRHARILDLAIVKKTDKEGRAWLKATLSVRVDLGERIVREFLFHHFGEYRLFSFMPEQLALPTGASAEREPATTRH